MCREAAPESLHRHQRRCIVAARPFGLVELRRMDWVVELGPVGMTAVVGKTAGVGTLAEVRRLVAAGRMAGVGMRIEDASKL